MVTALLSECSSRLTGLMVLVSRKVHEEQNKLKERTGLDFSQALTILNTLFSAYIDARISLPDMLLIYQSTHERLILGTRYEGLFRLLM